MNRQNQYILQNDLAHNLAGIKIRIMFQLITSVKDYSAKKNYLWKTMFLLFFDIIIEPVEINCFSILAYLITSVDGGTTNTPRCKCI